MKKYESVFILDESKLEGGAETFAASITAYVESLSGKVLESETMGRKTFCQPIGKKTGGVYWNFILELSADQVVAFKENYRLNQSVLRQEVFTYDRPEKPVTLSNRK